MVGTEAFLTERSPHRPAPPPPSRTPARAPTRLGWTVAAVLFAATAASTYLVGGAAFSASLLLILGAHELGHFLQARRYGVPASPPFFLPMPFTPIGTMGAIIAMRAQIADRRSLFDIAISGPLAGLVPTLVLSIVGLAKSRVVWGLHGTPEWLSGKPLLFRALELAILGPLQPGQKIEYHPIAVAAWTGLFVTALNLIPIGQLDGGHVLYALRLRQAHVISLVLLAAAALAVLFGGFWEWSLLVLLLLLLGPRHPPTADDGAELGRTRTVLGYLTLAFLIVGFTATPFAVR